MTCRTARNAPRPSTAAAAVRSLVALTLSLLIIDPALAAPATEPEAPERRATAGSREAGGKAKPPAAATSTAPRDPSDSDPAAAAAAATNPAPEAVAPATPPPAVRGRHDGESIRRKRRTTGSAAPTTRSTTAPAVSPGVEFRRVAVALGVVIALILVLRWLAKRFFATPGLGGGTRAVQVLSRSMIAPKQQLLLVQVGKRIVVVADSGGQMSSLAEISDPDEVASLVGQVLEEKGAASARSFTSLLGRMRRSYDDADEAERAARPAGFGFGFGFGAPSRRDGNDADADADADTRTAIVSEGGDDDRDPGLRSTRSEIQCLMDKVRLISRQFKSP